MDRVIDLLIDASIWDVTGARRCSESYMAGQWSLAESVMNVTNFWPGACFTNIA